MTYSDNDITFEPPEQHEARTLKEVRTIQLYLHIFQSLCAMVEANVFWHDGIFEASEYRAKMTNQLRSIVYNLIELRIGRRPNKLG